MPKITINSLSGLLIGTIDINENQQDINLIKLLIPVIDIYREQGKKIAYKCVFNDNILFSYNGEKYTPNIIIINILTDTKYNIIFQELEEDFFNTLNLDKLYSYFKYIDFNTPNNILNQFITRLTELFTYKDYIKGDDNSGCFNDKNIIKTLSYFILSKITSNDELFIDFIILLLIKYSIFFKYLPPNIILSLNQKIKHKSNLISEYNFATIYLATNPNKVKDSLYNIINSYEYITWKSKRHIYRKNKRI